MLRRKENYLPDLLTVGGLTLNRSTYELSWQGKSQSLSGREFQILEMLMERPRLCGDHQPAALPRVGLGQRRGLQRGVGGTSPTSAKSWPGWAPRQGYASCGGQGMCWRWRNREGAALGGSFFLMGGKKAPGSFLSQALRETGFSFRNGAPSSSGG